MTRETPVPCRSRIGDLRLVDLRSVVEPNGTLVVADAGPHVPFDIVRVFAVTAVAAGERRGSHAHRRLNQFLICVNGSVAVTVDDGRERRTMVLDHLSRALHVPPGVWAEQVYSGPDAVLMVLCDRPYEEEDYIRDYAAFRSYRNAIEEA